MFTSSINVSSPTVSWAAQVKPILLICDNPRLGQVLAFNVHDLGELTLFVVGAEHKTPPPATGWRLIILALSASDSEPVVMLAQAGLLGRAWQPAPLLVISDRPFAPDPARGVYHLLFPFDMPLLRHQLQVVLA